MNVCLFGICLKLVVDIWLGEIEYGMIVLLFVIIVVVNTASLSRIKVCILRFVFVFRGIILMKLFDLFVVIILVRLFEIFIVILRRFVLFFVVRFWEDFGSIFRGILLTIFLYRVWIDLRLFVCVMCMWWVFILYVLNKFMFGFIMKFLLCVLRIWRNVFCILDELVEVENCVIVFFVICVVMVLCVEEVWFVIVIVGGVGVGFDMYVLFVLICSCYFYSYVLL